MFSIAFGRARLRSAFGSSIRNSISTQATQQHEKHNLDSYPLHLVFGAPCPSACVRSACRDEEARLVGRALERRGLDSNGAAGKERVHADRSGSEQVGRLPVLVIDGLGRSKLDGSTVHTALAFVSYDERAKTFRWHAFTAEGHQTDTVAKVGTNRVEWGLEISQRGRMRYTITLNEKGEWFEVGEMSQDAQTWHKFFEMTLQRQE